MTITTTNKWSVWLAALALFACAPTREKPKTLHEYDLNEPQKYFMPESLLEISGIAFYQHRADTVYAIQDEDGNLYRLATGVKKQHHTRFGKKGDYEDVAIINEQVIVLKSNGALITFPFSDATSTEVPATREHKKVLPKGEYEGMAADEKTGELYVLCKNCKQDDGQVQITGAVFSVSDSLEYKRAFTLDVTQIVAKTDKMKAGFRPSGLARHPLNGDWYIISAVNKLIVVIDADWKLKEAVHLNSDVFNQPEGIAFDEDANLYISNEGGDLSEGNILKFKRQPH